MSLIQGGLKVVASYDKTAKRLTTTTPTLRYADKGETVASVINSVMTETLADSNFVGITKGLTKVIERQTKSRAQVMHHNCRVSFKMPSVTPGATLDGNPQAVNKMEDVTVSVSLSVPTRVALNTQFVDSLGDMLQEQLAQVGLAYNKNLVDLLVEA